VLLLSSALLFSLSHSSALYNIFNMVSESPFLWPPIKWYSRSFFGVPFGGCPTPADHVTNAVFPLFLQLSFRSLVFLSAVAQLQPTMSPMRYSRSSFSSPFGGRPSLADRSASSSGNFCQAYRTATETPLGQKNYQKWCLNPGSMDLCNFSPFQCCTCTTLLPKRHIRHSESRSEEITAVQASTRLHVRPEGSVSLQARLTRSHTPPWCGTLLHTLVSRSHVLPHALDLLAREFHASMRLLAREMHVPMQTAGFWRVHTRARHSSNPTR
jgi:hypothetical protein